LELDPKLVEAHELRANLALEDSDPAGATQEADAAIQLSADALDAMAVHAAVELLADRSPDTWLDKIKQVKLEFWQDGSKQNALCSYSFQGWISAFQTVNPAGTMSDVTTQGQVLNNMLVIDITPQLNQTNQPNFTFSN